MTVTCVDLTTFLDQFCFVFVNNRYKAGPKCFGTNTVRRRAASYGGESNRISNHDVNALTMAQPTRGRLTGSVWNLSSLSGVTVLSMARCERVWKGGGGGGG